MAAARTLGDLARKNAQHLIVKSRTHEQKGASPAPLLHDIRNRRLNVDLGQHLDIVGVRHQKIRRWRDGTVRLVKERGPARGGSQIDLRTGGIVGPRPDLAKLARAGDALNLAPIRPPAFLQGGTHGAVIPGVHDKRQAPPGKAMMKRGRSHRRAKNPGHQSGQRLAVPATFDELGRRPQIATDAAGHRGFGM